MEASTVAVGAWSGAGAARVTIVETTRTMRTLMGKVNAVEGRPGHLYGRPGKVCSSGYEAFSTIVMVRK